MLNSTEKPETPIFHEPPDYIAVPPAAEAIGMAIGINSVRWTALRMKRAKRNIFTTGALQRDEYVALCPFHSERSPSYRIYPDGHAYCFGMAIGINSVRWTALRMKRAKRNIFTTGALQRDVHRTEYIPM